MYLHHNPVTVMTRGVEKCPPAAFSLHGQTQRTGARFASPLAAALLDELFEHPFYSSELSWRSKVDRNQSIFEFFNSSLPHLTHSHGGSR